MRVRITKPQAVGLAIQFARKTRDLTAEELSEAIGGALHHKTISKIERGDRRVDVQELELICEALNWPFEWLRQPPFPTDVIDIATLAEASSTGEDNPGYLALLDRAPVDPFTLVDPQRGVATMP